MPMNTRGLHFSAPILKLAQAVAPMSPNERAALWSAYRALRRAARDNTLPHRIEQLARHLAERASSVERYKPIALALRLARAYSRQALAQQGAQVRAQRLIVEEAFQLLHLRFRELLGLRAPRRARSWSTGGSLGTGTWVAVCDGSFKQTRSAIGVVVVDGHGIVRAEIALPVEAASSVEAELRACHMALLTLSTFGVRRARVLVDAQSVLSGLHQALPLHLSVHEANLLHATRAFDALEVTQVSRVHTMRADRLAAELSSH